MSVCAPKIPDMELFDEVGRGARNAVFRARRRGRMVALKVPRFREDLEAIAGDYRREAALQAQVVGPSLPEVYEVGSHEGVPYLVTEGGGVGDSSAGGHPRWRGGASAGSGLVRDAGGDPRLRAGPPGPEAREHPDDRAWASSIDRLRPGHPVAFEHGGGRYRDVSLQRARTNRDARPSTRRPGRSLCPRRGAVRMPGGASAVCGR